jgi:hypothetical protein
MITATVTVTTESTSLFDLINTALPGKVSFDYGRVAEIQITWAGTGTETFYLFSVPGTVNGESGPQVDTGAGYRFGDYKLNSSAESLLVLRHGGGNALSLSNVYLGTTSGTVSAMILAYIV